LTNVNPLDQAAKFIEGDALVIFFGAEAVAELGHPISYLLLMLN